MDQQLIYPIIDLDAIRNPAPAIAGSSDLAACAVALDRLPGASRSLLGGEARAFIYSLVRNMRPEHVVEIGTFRGGTAEAIARALVTNGRGKLHTVGPYDSEHFLPFFKKWERALRECVEFYPTDSMAFFMECQRRRMRPDIVFVDGDHTYPFALFDIQCAASCLRAGGFLIVDNVSQAGPYHAVIDFLAQNPAWENCTTEPFPMGSEVAFDRGRVAIVRTGFLMLRAPVDYIVGRRPMTTGEVGWTGPTVKGARFTIAAVPDSGSLRVEMVLRGFGAEQAETATAATMQVRDKGPAVIEFDPPLSLPARHASYRVEPWLAWSGPALLRLKEPPAIF